LTAPDRTNDETEDHSLVFSPSNVRRLTKGSGHCIEDSLADGESGQRGVHSKLFSSALQSVVKGVVPAAGTAGTLASRAVYGAGVTVSGKFGECLVGHSKEDFEQAVRYKQELLTELSYARTALGHEQEKKVGLERKVEALADENTRLKTEVNTAIQKKNTLEFDMNTVRSDLAGALDQIMQLENQLKESFVSREKLEAKIMVIANEVHAKDKLIHANQSITDKLSADLKKSQMAAGVFAEDNIALKRACDDLLNEVKVLKQEGANMSRDIECLMDTNSNPNQEAACLLSTVSSN